MPTLPKPDDTAPAPDVNEQFGRVLSEDEVGLLAQFTPPEEPSEARAEEEPGGVPEGGSPAQPDGTQPAEVADGGEPAAAEPAPTESGDALPAPAATDGTIDFLGARITEQQAQTMAVVAQWYFSLTPQQQTDVETYTRTGQFPQAVQPAAQPQPQVAVPGTPQAAAAEAPAVPQLSAEELATLDPDVARVVQFQQQQYAAQQQQYQALQAQMAELAQYQQAQAAQSNNSLADEVTDAFMTANGFDPKDANERLALTTAAAPHAQYLQAQGVTDMRRLFEQALTTAMWTDERFRAKAIAATTQQQTDAQVAETLAIRQKAAKSGQLAGSAASVPRDAPTVPDTKEGRQAALAAAIAGAMAPNGQG